MEEAATTNIRFSRTTNLPCPAGYPEGVCATTEKDVPRHREAFKQLVTLISGRRAKTDTPGESRELSASGKAKGYIGGSREQLASGKAKGRQHDGLQEQPRKRARTTSDRGLGGCLVPGEQQQVTGGASSSEAPGNEHGDKSTTTVPRDNWMKPDADDVMSSILVSICSRVENTEAEEAHELSGATRPGRKRVGKVSNKLLVKNGKVCQAQQFCLHEPVVGHQLAISDADDGAPQLEPGQDWWQWVEELIQQDDMDDRVWWDEVEAAIKDEEASGVHAGKREHEATRSDDSKRLKKPG